MSRELFRNAAGLSIGVGIVAAAAWYFALSESHRRLGEATLALTRQQLTLASIPSLAADAEARETELAERLEHVQRLIAATPEPAELYATLQKLAKDAGVQLERMEPSGLARRAVDLTRQAGFMVENHGYEMAVSGTYEQLVVLMRSLEQDLGLAKVTSVRAQPRVTAAGMVQAEVTVVVFDAKPVIANPKEKRK